MKFKVSDPDGNTIVLEGDSPPTEQELEDIFSSRYSTPNRSESNFASASLPSGVSDEFNRNLIQPEMDPSSFDASWRSKQRDAAAVAPPTSTLGQAYDVLAEPGKQLTQAISVNPQTTQNAMDVVNAIWEGVKEPNRFMDGRFTEELGQRDTAPGTAAQIVTGAQNLGAGVAGSFADPVNAGVMLATGGAPALAPLVDAAFGAHMLAQVPQNIRDIKAAQTPYEKTMAYGGLGLNVGLGGALAGKGGVGAVREGMKFTPRARADTAQLQAEQFQVAPRQKLVQEFNQLSDMQPSPERDARLQQIKAQIEDAGLADSHQAAIDKAAESVDAPVKVVWGTDPSDLKPGQVARAGGADGKTIELIGENVGDWLANVRPSERVKKLDALLKGEEQVHLQTDSSDAERAGELASSSDIANLGRIYGHDFTFKEIPGETSADRYQRIRQRNRDIGYELIRLEVNKAQKMTPGEFMEMSIGKRMTVQTLDAMHSFMEGVKRNIIGSDASEQRKMHMTESVDRVLENIKEARPAAEAREGKAPAGVREDEGKQIAKDLNLKWEGGYPLWQFSAEHPVDGTPITFGIKPGSTPEQIKAKADNIVKSFEGSAGLGEGPAGIRKTADEIVARPRGETTAEEINAMDAAEAAKLFTYKNESGDKNYQPQYDAVFAGMKAGPQEIPKFEAMRDENHKAMMDAVKSGNQQELTSTMSKMMWASAAIEGAKREGGNYKSAVEIATKRGELPDFAQAAGVRKGKKEPQRLMGVSQQLMLGAAPVARGEKIPERTVGGIAYEKPTPNKLDALVATSLTKDVPSFEDFVGNARVQFGHDLKPEQLNDLWQSGLVKHLENASGPELTRLVDQLNLRRQVGMMRIGDAPVDVKGVEAYRESQIARSQRMDKLADKLEREADVIKSKTERLVAPPGEKATEVSQGELLSAGAQVDIERSRNVERENLLRKRASQLREQSNNIASEARRAKEVPADVSETSHQLGLGLFTPSGKSAPEATPLTTYTEKTRARAIGAIFQKLAMQSHSPKKPWNRKEITVDELAWQKGPEAFQTITEHDLESSAVLGSLLTKGARSDASTTGTTGGGTRRITMKGAPESVTKRVTVLLDKENGTVHQVSTYRHGRLGTMLLDPRFRGDVHRRMDMLLDRYRPIYTMLLNTPVKSFYKKFESVDDFNSQFGHEANNRAAQSSYGEAGVGPEEDFSAEGTPGLEGEGGFVMGPSGQQTRAMLGMTRGALESGADLTPNEARITYNAFKNLESSKDAHDLVGDLNLKAQQKKLTPADWNLINAMRKVYESLREAHDDLTDGQIMDLTLEELYGIAKKNETEGSAVASTTRQYAKEPALPVQSGAQAQRGTELTMPIERVPPTTIRPEQLPPYAPTVVRRPPPQEVGGHLGGLGPRPEPEMLSPSQKAALKRRVERTGMWRSKEGKGQTGISSMSELDKLRSEGRQGPAPQTMGGPAGIRGTVEKAIRAPVSGYSEWMVDRIGRLGGPNAKAASEGFRHIVDRAKELYGSLTPILDPAKAAAGATKTPDIIGQRPSLSRMKATKWLHGLNEVTPWAARSNTVGAIEGTMPTPGFAHEVVDLGRKANLAIGNMIARVTPGFKAGGYFQRNMTALGVDTIRQGGGEMWKRWTFGLAKDNWGWLTAQRQFALAHGLPDPGGPVRMVQDAFKEFKKVLDEPGISADVVDKVNQDFQRKFPNVITHVKGATGWQPMLHSDLFNYLENAAQRASHIVAFREQFPNTTSGKAALQDVVKNAAAELPPAGVNDLHALIRTLQGRPTDTYSSLGFLGPTEVGGQSIRMFNQTVGNIFAKLVLSGQVFRQPGENIAGSTPAFLGYQNYLRAAGKIRQLYPELEKTGAVNRVMYDFSYDPNSKIRSAFKIAGNTISKVFAEQALNELQEAHAAATAKVVSDRIQSGTLDAWEKRMLPETFKAMGFSKSDAANMMLGDPALLGQFERKAAAFLTSGNKAISENSRLGANRLANSIFRFQSYPMMKANQFAKVASRFYEAWTEGSGKDKAAATEMFARHMGYNTVQGALTVGIAALMTQKLFGLKVATDEAKDDPLNFLVESYASSIGGPMYLMWRGAKEKGALHVTDMATRMVFPFAIASDMRDMADGAGQYRDMGTFDRIGKFLKGKTPGLKPIQLGAALVGLSTHDADLDTSISAYYRWYKQTFDQDFTSGASSDEFRTQMKKAVTALKNGDKDAFMDAKLAAAGAATGGRTGAAERVASSFRSRKLLKTPDGQPLNMEQKDALRNRIGDAAYDKLFDYDLMLETAADGL